METLCRQLRDWSSRWRRVEDWPDEALRLCADAGVYRWFLPPDQGGFGWSEADQVRGYLRLAEVDLTTTFVITQYMGAIRRIAASENREVARKWLEPLVSGASFGTVGFSHLTTSRQHLSRPVLEATETESGFILNGMAPWVTGVPHADLYVIGATLGEGRELLLAVSADAPGLAAGDGCGLVALSASCTDRLEFDSVHVDRAMILAGPKEKVMQSAAGSSTGGLQTSTLAIGLARAAASYLGDESMRRDDLRETAEELGRDVAAQEARLLRAAEGDQSQDASEIRGAANRLVLRATQAALIAAKGAGFVAGHPAGRWCQEALFFLVWSCPQPVSQAHLCELAGLEL